MKTGRFIVSNYPSTHKTLLEKIQAGDEISWQEFYERYSPIVLRGVASYGLSEQDAEEVLQDVMLKFFRNDLVTRYDAGKARFRTYFNQVIVSCIYDFLREKKKYSQEIRGEHIPDFPITSETENLFLEEWHKQMLEEALEQLRAQVKAETFLAFHLTVFLGKSIQDTADFLHLEPNMIYVARSRCIARLREIISSINQKDPGLDLKWNPPD